MYNLRGQEGRGVMQYFEIRLKEAERYRFIEVAKRKMEELHWTSSDLARETGYTLNSIYSFFGGKQKYPNKRLAGKIATVLQMERSEWKC